MYTVDHPADPSVYERFVGHRVNDVGEEWKAVPHPDNCMDCAANPGIASEVHRGEVAVLNAIEALRPFFSSDTPESLILNIAMTAHLSIQRSLAPVAEG